MSQIKRAKCERCDQLDLVYPVYSVRLLETLYICMGCKIFITKLREFSGRLNKFIDSGGYKYKD